MLEAADVTTADLPATKIYSGTPRSADDVVGKRLSRSLKTGDSFNTLTLKTVSAVERNTLVTVLFKRPGIELLGQGLALESGTEGKAIRVLNQDSKVTLVATVTAPGTVTIGESQ